MANAYTYQIIKDTTQKTIIKLTGEFDGSGQESNVSRIQANTLYGALANDGTILGSNGSSNVALSFYGTTITKLNYIVNMGTTGYVKLSWAGSTPATIALLNRDGQMGEEQGMSAIPNNANTPTGDISVSTVGAVANASYTIIIELRKDNAMFDRGQSRDPAAFNYPPYNLRP